MLSQTGDLALSLLTQEHREIIQSERKLVFSYEDILAGEINKANPILKAHTDSVASLSLTSDNSILLSASRDNTVRVWSMIRRKEEQKFEIPVQQGHSLLKMVVSNDYKYLALSDTNKHIIIWDVALKKVVITITVEVDELKSLAISNDSKFLAAPFNDTTVKIWDITNGREVKKHELHTCKPYFVCFTDRLLLSADGEGHVVAWNYERGTEEFKLHQEGLNSYTVRGHISYDYHYLALGYGDSKLVVWNLAERCVSFTLDLSYGTVTAVHYSKEGKNLALSTTDKKLVIIDLEEKKVKEILVRHSDTINDVVQTKDGKMIITASSDKLIKILQSGEAQDYKASTKYGNSLRTSALDPINSNFVVGYSNSIKLFSLTEDRETLSLTWKGQSVQTAILSHDHKHFLTSNDQPEIAVFSVEKKEIEFTLTGMENSVCSLILSSDSKWLYGGDAYGNIYVWDYEKKTLDHKLVHEKNGNYRLALSQDGQRLYSAGDSCIKIWDLPTRTPVAVLECDSTVKTLVLLSDGKTLISGGNEGKVKFWNLEDNSVISFIDEGGSWARDMFLYKEEQFLAVVHDTSKVTIVNVPEKKIEFDFEGPNSMYSVRVLEDNNTLIMTDSQNIRFWNLELKKEESIIQAHTGNIPSLLILKDLDLLISVSNDRTIKEWSLSGKNQTSLYQNYCGTIKTLAVYGDHILIGSEDSNVIVISISDKKEIKSFGFHSGTVQSVDISGGVFATGGNDRKVFVFDSSEYKPHCFEGHSDWVRCVRLSTDSKIVFSASDDKTVCAWNIEKKALEYKLEGHEGYVYSLSVFPSGKFIASGSGDKRVKIWDLALRKESASLEYHSANVTALKVTDDEKILYSGSEDFTIVISDIQQKKLVCTLSGHASGINKLDLYNNILYSTGNDEVKTWLTTEKREEHSFRWRTDHSSYLTVSPDGNYLAAGFSEGSVRIFNFNQHKFLDTFQPIGSKTIDKVQFTKDSKKLVIGASDASIFVWDIEQKIGHEIKGSQSKSRSLCFSPDHKYLVSAGHDNKILFWNFENEKEEFFLEGHTNSLNNFVFSPCGNTLFSCADDNKVMRWDIEKREKVAEYSEHNGSVKSIALAHIKNILVSGANDSKVIFWDVVKNEKLFIGDKHTDWVRGVAVSPDENFAVSGSDDKTIHLWDLNDKEFSVKYSFKGHSNYVYSLAFSLDGKHLYSASSDKTIQSWNFVAKKRDTCIRSTCGSINCIVINSEGTRAYTGSDENSINIFDLTHKTEIACLGGHTRTIGDLALSKDEKLLVSGSFDNTLKVFDLSDNSEIVAFGEGVHSDYVRTVAITDNNKYVLSGSDDKLIVVWNLAEKKKEFSLEGHRNYVYSIRFTPDYKYLISASRDETLKLWDFSAKTDVYTFIGHTAAIKCLVVFHNNSGFISGGEDSSIKVWNIADKREAFTLLGHTSTVNTLFLTLDDVRLISGSDDRLIKVWNLEQRTTELAITSYTSGILSVALTHDGRYLLSSASDRILKLWKMSEPVADFSLKTLSSKPYLSVYTPDNEYELVYLYGKLDSVVKTENSSKIAVEMGITDIFDPYYQNLLTFYNVIESLRNDIFDNLLPDSANIIFSRFSYSVLHVLSFKGNAKAIQNLLNDKVVITADYFGKSPLFYALVRQNQGCVDLILEFLISLSESKDKSRISTCFSVISNDLAMIISNSSKKLHLLLKSCLIPTEPTFARVNRLLPMFKYNDKFLPIATDFVGEPPRTIPLVPVVMKYTPFKLPSLLGSQGSIEFLESVMECSNTDIYKVHLIQYLIQLQWDQLIYWVSGYSILLWINLVMLVILFTVDSLLDTWAFPVFLLVNFMLMTWETVQMFIGGIVEYFKDAWNLIDFCRFTLTLAWVLMNLFEDEHGITYRVLAWLVALLNFTRGLTGFRLFDGTRYYVRLIIRAISDMGYFLILLSYSTITFGVMFQVSRKGEPFEFKTLWMDSYSLNFGNFEPQENYSFSFETIAYMLATVVNVILMLNLLISILGDSYSNFQTDKVYIDFSEKAGVIIEIQKMFFWVGKESNPRYFQVLCSSTAAEEETPVDELIDALDKKIDNMNTEFLSSNQNTKNELSDSIKLLSNKVDTFESKLAGLTENVLKIIELVTPKEVKPEEVKTEEVKA